MDGVPIGLNRCHDNFSIVIFDCDWLHDSCGSSFHSLCVDAFSIINCESNILDTIPMLGMMSRELLMIRIIWRLECKSDLSIPHNMCGKCSLSSLESL